MVAENAEVLAGKYRLVRQLGQGGMGAVWQAEHITLHAMVAVKLLDPLMAQTKDGLNRFLREAQAAASLRSPHIVQILDHGIDRGTPYIAMELLDGESLGSRLDRVTRLSPAETARVIMHAARAMTRAHEAGVVHRDLKPDNIFMVPNDDEEIVKVLDFGIAKSTLPLAANISDSTRTGTMLGTPYYMSPEQVESATNADYRTDIWALGVIAYQCIVGRRPFEAETIGGLFLAICSKEFPVPSSRGTVPRGFDEWFAHCCARDPAQRFASAREAAVELRRVCNGEVAPTSVDPDSTEGIPSHAKAFANTTGQGAAVGYSAAPRSRRSIATTSTVVAAVLVAGVIAWQASRSTNSESSATPTNDSASAKQPIALPSVAALPGTAGTPPATTAAPPATSASQGSVGGSGPSPVAPRHAPMAPRTAPRAPSSRPTAPRTPNVDLGL
jgi:serine/threonine protein kinase